MTRALRQGRGFTLIEFLLALMLLALLVGLAYGGLRTATRAADRGQDVLQHTAHVRMAHQFVRGQFSRLLPLPYEVGPGDVGNRIVFEGGRDYVQYVAVMPGYLGTGGPQVQRIELAPHGEGGMALWFQHAPLLALEEAGLGSDEPILLLEGVEDASFLFLGRDEQGELLDWTETWTETDLLPAAISLDVTLSEDRQVDWPLLVTRLQLDETAITGSLTGTSETYENAIQSLIRGERPGDNP
ncbi:MAG: prepilin-type N-terminal cleavage/methylation domain-containing protein [Xanthomonadales bacterium]|nr:prepilin-type N-terminal cleavage/methylation domain-containing protein [Xanthomonadales bacterium]